MTIHSSHEFNLKIGPFIANVVTDVPDLMEKIRNLYLPEFLYNQSVFSDFHVELVAPNAFRRWLRPQIEFRIDGVAPYRPLPRSQALPMLEWGLNGCISSRCHQYLVFHAAALERNGRAVIMPGRPGSGKSTLSAALASRGWRLLSDELTLIAPSSGSIIGLARPISLKNDSIHVLRSFASTAVLSDPISDTSKGTVALMRAPDDSMRRVSEEATPTWIVFPKWQSGVVARLQPMRKGLAFMQCAQQSFNYSIYGEDGFNILSAMIDKCETFTFTYSDLDDAIRAFDELSGACGNNQKNVYG